MAEMIKIDISDLIGGDPEKWWTEFRQIAAGGLKDEVMEALAAGEPILEDVMLAAKREGWIK